ncbi:MAG: leucine-rich repeat domain-containing protein, partial [Clostridia bacterium]|nr:leucine-rich repeat domain-containing protein [Clostridia bacterium]
TGLCEITVPGGVKEIASFAFLNCKSLTRVVFAGDVTDVAGDAFRDCCNIGTVVLSERMKIRFGHCFRDTKWSRYQDLKTGAIQNIAWSLSDDGTLFVMGKGEMTRCAAWYPTWKPFKDRIRRIEFDDTVTLIAACAFDGCRNLTRVKLPAGLSEIKENTFSRCRSLAQVEIPAGVKRIGQSAFCGCKRLCAVLLPESVTEIGHAAFAKCDALKEIRYMGSAERFAQLSLGNNVFPKGVKIITGTYERIV